MTAAGTKFPVRQLVQWVSQGCGKLTTVICGSGLITAVRKNICNIISDSDRSLYYQTLPVLLNSAPRITVLANRNSTMLSARMATDVFNAGENMVIAQGFVLRTIFPLLGRICPELTTEEATAEGIAQRHAELNTIVGSIDVLAFEGAACRRMSHAAGDVQLQQSTTDYIQLSGLPNFFFHMAMSYATLRARSSYLNHH